MVASLLLLASLFHHKSKPKPLTPEQRAFIQQLKEDKKYVTEATQGIAAYEADFLYAQYERPEIDRFEKQLTVCFEDTDPVKFDADVTTLLEYRTALDALDKDLHRENAI